MSGGIYLLLTSNTLSIVWGHYLVYIDYFSRRGPCFVHQRILMFDKHIEHAVDYFSQHQIEAASMERTTLLGAGRSAA